MMLRLSLKPMQKRSLLRGVPLSFLLAVLITAGTTVWFPKGDASINNIVFPLFSLPVLWLACLYPMVFMTDRRRLKIGLGLLAGVHGGLILYKFLTVALSS